MKKMILCLCSMLICGIFCSPGSFGQGVTTIKVIDMPGFPDLPLDSALEGQPYAFDIIVVNGTNTFINTTLEIVIRVDSIESVIGSNPQPSIPPGDTLTISLTGYNFTQPQFKSGHNIVVVWPRVISNPLPVDTFFTVVNFIPLNAMGGNTIIGNAPDFVLYPNPVSNQLIVPHYLNYNVEHVRIFSSAGNLVYEDFPLSLYSIDVSILVPGIYYMEVYSNGIMRRSKFVRQQVN